MGSFDYTCAVSGLPIGSGDPVRYLLLTQNPYHRGKSAADPTYYPIDLWFPRTFPLRGKYDECGGVDDLQEGPQTDAWVAGFKVDLCEKGWGDNACHDVPARKNMTIGKLLEAVREGRIHVRPDVGEPKKGRLETALAALGDVPAKRRPRVTKGIPTRLRVERALVKLGHKIAEEYRGGMLVNRVDANTVRVRAGEFGKRVETLTAVRDALAGKWAGAVCCGTGNYADDAELLLRPLPGVRRRTEEKRRAALCVSHAMIREDVWQAICAMPLSAEYEKTVTVDECRAAARAVWAKSLGVDNFGRFMMRHDAHFIVDDAIPFTVGLGTHWWAMVAAHKSGKVTDAERDDFLATAGEFSFVMQWLARTRYQWHPSSLCGPQNGLWSCHARLLGAYREIAARVADEEEAERAKWASAHAASPAADNVTPP